jgi:hypothetical protein
MTKTNLYSQYKFVLIIIIIIELDIKLITNNIVNINYNVRYIIPLDFN